MIRTPHAVIVITRRDGAAVPKVHVIDLGLDEARRQIGTHEETQLDRFILEHGLKLTITPAREDGRFRASLDANLRDPRDRWRLMTAWAEGRTRAEARRNLAERISEGTLVVGACHPYSRSIPVPDLLRAVEPLATEGETE